MKRGRDSRIVLVGSTVSAIAAALGLLLQLVLVSRFNSSHIYQTLLSILGVTLPFSMMYGTSGGLFICSNQVPTGDTGCRLNVCAAIYQIGLTCFVTVVVLVIALLVLQTPKLSGQMCAIAIEGILVSVCAAVMQVNSQVLSMLGRHGLALGSSLAPNLFSLGAISLFSQKFDAFSYVLGWVAGSLIYISAIHKLIRDNTSSNAKGELKTLKAKDMLQIARGMPSIFIFGIHQALDAVILPHINIALLPFTAIMQRLIVTIGNTANSGFLSLTVQDFSNEHYDEKTRQSRLKRRKWILCFLGVIALAVWIIIPEMVFERISMISGKEIPVGLLWDSIPYYIGGAVLMLATVLNSRVLIIRNNGIGMLLAGIACGVVYIGTMLFLPISISLVKISLAYCLSWMTAFVLSEVSKKIQTT